MGMEVGVPGDPSSFPALQEQWTGQWLWGAVGLSQGKVTGSGVASSVGLTNSSGFMGRGDRQGRAVADPGAAAHGTGSHCPHHGGTEQLLAGGVFSIN